MQGRSREWENRSSSRLAARGSRLAIRARVPVAHLFDLVEKGFDPGIWVSGLGGNRVVVDHARCDEKVSELMRRQLLEQAGEHQPSGL